MTAFPKGYSTFAEYNRFKQHVPWGAQSTIIQPPYDTANNVWAFDPDQIGAAQYQVGPTGTITTPAKTQGAPSYYTYGSTDFIDFGNSLESTWDSAGGFTLYVTIKPSSGNIATANAPVLTKLNVGVSAEFAVILNSGVIDFYGVYGGTYFTNYDVGHSGTLVAGTRYVIACTFNPAAARTSRPLVYVNGTVSGVVGNTVGADGVITATATPLRLGFETSGTIAPVSIGSYAYAYNGVHSAGTVASITSWLQNTKGWV